MGCRANSAIPQEIVGPTDKYWQLARKFLAEKPLSLGNIYTQALIVMMLRRTCRGSVTERSLMSPASPEPQEDGPLRSAILKAVRKARALSTVEVAAGMGIVHRTYEHFEAGHGRLNLDYLHRFSEVTQSDFYGLMHAIAIGSPEFAVRTADNKFMTSFTVLLQAYDRRMGDRIRDLDARALIAAFGEMFDRLAAEGEQRAEEAAAFLKEGREDLSSRRSKPGR